MYPPGNLRAAPLSDPYSLIPRNHSAGNRARAWKQNAIAVAARPPAAHASARPAGIRSAAEIPGIPEIPHHIASGNRPLPEPLRKRAGIRSAAANRYFALEIDSANPYKFLSYNCAPFSPVSGSAIVTVKDKYQVVIPRHVREQIGVAIGDVLEARAVGQDRLRAEVH